MNRKLCPKCGQQSINFLSFLTKFNQSKIRCRHCGVLLKGNKLLRIMFYSTLIFCLSLGISIAFLEDSYNWSIVNSLIVVIPVITLIGIPLEIICWKYGNYTIDDKNN